MSKRDWKKRRDSFKRPIGKRGKPKDRILIVCGGEKTEPNYFTSFRVSSADVKVIGFAYDPLKLVNSTIYLRDKAQKDDEAFQQVWCVMSVNYNSRLTTIKIPEIKN